jgi:transposase, IS5 family
VAIDMSGQDILPNVESFTIKILENHPLYLLARSLPWATLMGLVAGDLKQTTARGKWWMGRKITVRLHLAVYLLQKLYNLTDRKIEYQVKDNAAFQMFCGRSFLVGWHSPDHTKIEEFRNRLSPETQRELANTLAQTSVSLGFGDPRETDFDSTAQEANISYPSDANLMTKFAEMGKKVVDLLKEKFPKIIPKIANVDIKKIKKKARKYFFLAKNKTIDVKREIFKDLHQGVKQEMRKVIGYCQTLSESQIAQFPWNIKRSYDQVMNYGWRYLLDVAHFIRTQTIKSGKILSLHAKDVKCIVKGKIGKEFEFGRVFQLGRIKGNFIFVLKSTSLEMNDKLSFKPLLEEHTRIFGEKTLETIAADKGYWSAKNRRELRQRGMPAYGLQKPLTIKEETNVDLNLKERLHNRRAGIEPLIGHVKHGGQLGRSRMKSDKATLASGYGSVLGFNMRQLIRYQQGKIKLVLRQKSFYLL